MHQGKLAVQEGGEWGSGEPKPRISIPGEEAEKLFEYLQGVTDAVIRVSFHKTCGPEDLYYLIAYDEKSTIEFDELSRRRITAVLGSKERSRMDPHRTFSFRIRNGFDSFGSKQGFWRRVSPRLELIEVF